jgi:putative flippase GtrA
MRKVASFLAVGGASAVVYSILCTLLVKAFPGYPVAISIGVHACLIPFAFFAQRIVTFASSGIIAHEFLRYAGVQIASISFSALTLSQLVGHNSILNLLVFLSISAFAALVSFVICNFYVFRAPAPEPTSSGKSNFEDDSV